MLIIAGHVNVDPDRRDEYLAAFQDLTRRCRQAPGCLDVVISADLLDPSRVNIFERWESGEHLDAWRAIAAAPDLGEAIKTADVMKYTVTDARSPFA